MALPTTPVQLFRGAKSTPTAIVKRNQHAFLRLFKINMLNGAGDTSAVTDPFEMLGKY